jgi:dTDP-4-amino-4,6-dideoxygalactose transaminase
MQQIISASLSPNTEAEDIRRAVGTFADPGRWQTGSAIKSAEEWFAGYFNDSYAVSFNSGRTALAAILAAFGIGKGDDVIIQAFTCRAVTESVRGSGARPVYADIDDAYNLSSRDAEKKITSDTRAIIVQHTFGIPGSMDEIVRFARAHGLFVIEDCAHSLGALYHGRKAGSLGDAAVFSFGRDKVVSSVWGGMATISKKSKVNGQKLRQFQEKLPYPSRAWIAQQLLHPIAFSMILPTYNLIFGKVILEAMKRMKLLSHPYPRFFEPGRYPNGLASLILLQLAKLARYNKMRRDTASYYADALRHGSLDGGGIYLRYPMLVDDPARIIKNARRHGILLGNWYHNVIDPKGTDLALAGYRWGSCPNAQRIAGHIVNLPTLISKEAAGRVIHAIQLD